LILIFHLIREYAHQHLNPVLIHVVELEWRTNTAFSSHHFWTACAVCRI